MNDTTQGGQNGQQVPAPVQTQPQPDPNQVTFLSVIKDSNSILVVLPTNPSFDQVAAGLSLYLSLQKHKPTQLFTPTPMTVEYNRLIGVDKISQELGNKNLILRFSGYDATNIEKVSYDIDDGQFKLTVIPKGDLNPPSKEQLNVSYSGVSVDTVVIVGGNDESSFPSVASNDLQGANVIHVGLKQISLASNKNFVSFTRVGSSVSEIVYGLIRENQLYIDPDIATNLLMGVEEIVGENFQGEGITAETFYTTADLMQYGAKRGANKGIQGNFPPGSIPGQLPTFNQPQAQTQPQPQNQPQNGLWGNQQVQTAQVQPQPVAQNMINPVPQQVQPQTQSQNQQQPQMETTEAEEVTEANAPEEWLQPKIYKGGSSN